MRTRAGRLGARAGRAGGRGADAVRLATTLAVTAAWLGAAAAMTLAADPTATPGGGDVRTTPAAPGVVGEPMLALAGVLMVGLLAAGVTLLAVRLTSRR